jgi:hypothetical protein
MDGHDQATLWYRLRDHDILVGARYCAHQRRRERAWAIKENKRWKTRMRLPRAHGPDLKPPSTPTLVRFPPTGANTPQIYTDWIYLWWIAYTSSMHGHLYIILKESIKYIPILGTGMMFYGFIFLSRKWATDKERFQHRLRKLSTSHSGPLSGSKGLDPMWLLLFPEGTNLSKNGRTASKKWADKNDMPDLRHALLPRSTGLSFCLQELKGTVEFVYDCTLAYEGVPYVLPFLLPPFSPHTHPSTASANTAKTSSPSAAPTSKAARQNP